MCNEYAGPNTVAYWTDFLSNNFLDIKEENWKFAVACEDKPIPPNILLDAVVRVESNTISLVFATLDEIRNLY